MLSRFASRAPMRTLACATACQTRNLNVHEYSSKKLLKDFGCDVEFGVMVDSLKDVPAAIAQVKTEKKVVKSQVLAGGRGKGTFKNGFQGGVHVCNNAKQAEEVAAKMLGQTLVTKQTGEKGAVVNKLFITDAIPAIKQEYYVALTLDRKLACPVFVASAEGGMNIEEVAATRPDAIKKMPVDVKKGLSKDEVLNFVGQLGFKGKVAENAARQVEGLYKLAKTLDATQVEINPMAELENGEVMCLDAKINFDDNAEFRQKEVWKHEDLQAKDKKELEASKWDLNYIALDGNVGCLVNGAGLAMATMDIIAMKGASPANFLDVGGSADAEQVKNALNIIRADPNVKAILVNIFGGIMKCDIIAQGVCDAVNALENFNVPMVVRLSGTNQELGYEIFRKNGMTNIETAGDMDEAATKVVAMLK